MGWFDFARLKASSPPKTIDIPIFPLNTVFFPGSRLPLKIFEQRYLDMAAACMKDEQPFGICLIESGQESGTPAHPHSIGTLATIGEWDMPQLGILMITVHGGQRFQIEQSRHKGNLLEATVTLLGDPETTPLPDERKRLLPLLTKVINDLGPERIAEPHRYDDAYWVGYRLSEILPIQNLAKQKLLELDDPLSRLEILERYLAQRNLLP